MADWADSADASCDRRHLREGPPLAEFFKAAVFRHVEAGDLYSTSPIEMDRDLGVSLDPGHGIDLNDA